MYPIKPSLGCYTRALRVPHLYLSREPACYRALATNLRRIVVETIRVIELP
jgi:hypothetical protein